MTGPPALEANGAAGAGRTNFEAAALVESLVADEAHAFRDARQQRLSVVPRHDHAEVEATEEGVITDGEQRLRQRERRQA